MRITDKFHFFWSGPFSNWYPATFEMDNIKFNNSEQAFMWLKAKHFDDVDIANKLVTEYNPEYAKALGRKVKNYNDLKWSEIRYQYMKTVLLCKFEQNSDLKSFLLDNAHLEIVEASPFDTIWGIGLHEDDDRCLDKTKWQGQNLLGKALNEVALIIK